MEILEAPTLLEIELIETETVMLSSQVPFPFCTSWSQDNKMLILVEGGVHVFELCPTSSSDQKSLNFIKSWISTSTSTPLATAILGDKNGTFLWNLKRKNAYEAVLDSTLSSVIQKPVSASGSPQIMQCEFSPLIQNKCYVSCLTNKGLLEIYENKIKKWLPVVNITELWISHCSVERNPKDINFNYFKSKMFQIKITAMKWCERPELFFLTCHENGVIAVWNAKVSNGNLEMSVRHCFNVEEKPCYLELSCMTNSKDLLLVIGTSSGLVKCFLVNLITAEIIQNFNLWKDKDLYSPNCIKIKHINEKFHIFIVKRNILLLQTVSAKDLNNYELVESNWEEFPTSIVSLNEYHKDLIVSLQNHDTYTLKVEDVKSVSIEKINMGVKSKQKVYHHCYGLTMSKNKAIWCLTSSPKTEYDSLKEITHLIFYSPKLKTYKSLSDVTSSGLIEQILKKLKIIRLCDVSDLLELKRLELLSDSTKFNEVYEINKYFSLIELQLVLWEVKLKSFCNLSEVDYSAEIEFAIAQKRAKKIVSDLEKLDNLSESQRKSLKMCQALLEKDKEKDGSGSVNCSICGDASSFENVRSSSCINSHVFPRCCLSLLPCDVVPYAICRNCSSVALLDFVTESDNQCPYCDGLLESDMRLRVGS